MSFLLRCSTRQLPSVLSRTAVRCSAAFSTTTQTLSRPTSNDATDQQAQSEAARTSNFAQAAAKIGSKMRENPEGITSEDAAHLKSREARATQQAQPPKDSMSAEAERLAAENEGNTKSSSSGGLQGQTGQSQRDREENFEEVVQEVGIKMDAVPERVTQEDASLLRSRETRAFGKTEKGGATAQAQSLAAENEKKGTI